MNLLIVSGSRADHGLLAWPTKLLKEAFPVAELNIWGAGFDHAYAGVADFLSGNRPDLMLVLGDRYEILAATMAAHLQRVPIAHIAGGDVTEGSYDDAMRDCISRMASIHFCTSTSAMARLTHMGFRNVHLVGNTAVDYIRNAPWKKDRPHAGPYVVVAYYPETIDGTVDLAAVEEAIAGRKAIWITPNPDRGVEKIPSGKSFSHDDFLNLIYHCDEFIGNSSAMLYEAPELGVKTNMIGKRQRGRTIPWGDAHASERIVNILKHIAL